MHRICKVIGDVPLDRLHEGHVTRLRDSLSDEGLSGSTVGDILRVLSQAMNRAVARRYIESNPADADLVTRPKSDPAEFVVVDAPWPSGSGTQPAASIPGTRPSPWRSAAA